MKLDEIPVPDTFWYEDEKGNRVDDKIFHGGGQEKSKWIQNSEYVVVRSSTFYVGTKPKLPVRILKWLLAKVPDSWKGDSWELTQSASINGSFPIIKYLIEERDFNFNEACVAASRMCDRCINLCCWECEDDDIDAAKQDYLDTINTTCDYCKIIDITHYNRVRTLYCYKTLKYGGNVAKAYKEVFPDKPYVPLRGVRM